AVAQFPCDRPEDAGSARVFLIVDQDNRVAVKLHVRAITAPGRIPDANDDAADDVARLDITSGRGFLHAGDDDVSQPGGAPFVPRGAAAQDLEAHHFLGPGVVGDVESRLHLDHGTHTLLCEWLVVRYGNRLLFLDRDRRLLARPGQSLVTSRSS